jgi:hypothetical protein
MRFALLLGGLAAALLPSHLGHLVPVATQLPASGSIAGVVVDSSGTKPVDGVTVTLRPFSGSVKGPVVTTDRNGSFSFTGLPPGSYVVDTDKDHWAPGTYGQTSPRGSGDSIVLATGRSVTGLRISMWELATLEGHLQSSNGTPVAGGFVEALRKEWYAGRPFFVGYSNAESDGDGFFRLVDCLPGEFALVATSGAIANEPDQLPRWKHDAIRETYFPDSASLADATVVRADWGDIRTGLDITVSVSPGSTVRGHVVGVPKPLPGLHVALDTPDDIDLMGLEPLTSLRADGTFVFNVVPPGRYVLQIDTTGLTSFPMFATAPLVVGEGETRNVAVQLRSPAQVNGRIQFSGPDASPDPRTVPVVLRSADGRGGREIKGSATRSGIVWFSSVLPGKYVVTALPVGDWHFQDALIEGRSVADSPLTVGASDVADVEVTFSKETTRLEGHVALSPGLRDVLVALFPVDPSLWLDYGLNPRRLKSVHPTPAGAFQFADVPPGDYYLVAFLDQAVDEWTSRPHLDQLAAVAERVQVVHGVTLSRSLKVVPIKLN